MSAETHERIIVTDDLAGDLAPPTPMIDKVFEAIRKNGLSVVLVMILLYVVLVEQRSLLQGIDQRTAQTLSLAQDHGSSSYMLLRSIENLLRQSCVNQARAEPESVNRCFSDPPQGR